MKIILTGSLGHISKPLTQELLEKGHSVTVISSKQEKQPAIEALGAIAAIGSIEDVDFLIQTFGGADAVYTMVPPNNYMDPNLDLTAYVQRIAHNYAKAIEQARVKRVVHLSSIGAHLAKGTGLILIHRAVEGILNELPNIAITFMRPTSFHYNLFRFMPAIKNTGIMAANYGAEDKVVWVSPIDIAAAVADELVTPLVTNESVGLTRKVRYVASNELTCNEVANIVGSAIGKPDLSWTLISDQQMQSGLEAFGMNPHIAAGLVEMQQCMHSGNFFQDYYMNRPAIMGKIKMTDFAKEFAAAFEQQ
ncbi:MAG: NAD(P)H-binding protein [Bacteroidota bacterium]